MSDPDDQQARQLHRQRVLKGATILNGVSQSEISCTIRNMHEHGAELRVSPEALVPTSFLLYVPVDGIAYQSELRWRTGNRAGVRFTGTAPKPHWHYG
ncbi:PilZ domain-containing protein [Tianweitania sediminis]|uniref:PilZ domain-containing protein n=1 Tax=Tianweitania sediminis TaxID=1502156 RepID=A0A8J7QZT7_9HYPH|nr:PilZ domain-containing protein [Tianweitania sediminis]MBP0439145.1 PilZ domain-containing protein [Tianweitania sediminis]